MIHSPTRYTPCELQHNRDNHLNIEETLRPLITEEETPWENKLEATRESLRRAEEKRRRHAEKHRAVRPYEVGDRVWVKLHHRSDASRRVTRKIHLIYDGPYRIIRILRRNAYLVEDVNGQPIGAYNTRQLRPDKETKLQDRYGLMEESTDEEPLEDCENQIPQEDVNEEEFQSAEDGEELDNEERVANVEMEGTSTNKNKNYEIEKCYGYKGEENIYRSDRESTLESLSEYGKDANYASKDEIYGSNDENYDQTEEISEDFYERFYPISKDGTVRESRKDEYEDANQRRIEIYERFNNRFNNRNL